MKKFKQYLLVLVLLPLVSIAATVRVGENYSLQKEEVVSGNLYAIGGNTTIVGEVEKDVFVTGANIFLGSENIGEDALVFADTAHIVSTIVGDIRVAARNAYIGGEVLGDVAVGALALEIMPQTIVRGDLLAAAGTVDVKGLVQGNVQIVAGSVLLNDQIIGNAHITSDSLILGPNARIEGNLTYSGSKPVVLENGSVVMGETTFNEIQTRSRAEKLLPTLWGTWIIIRFAVLLLFALAAHGILRAISTRFVTVSIHDPWWSMLRGFLFLLAVPVAAVIGVLTFIGIPFSLFALSLYGIAVILAAVYAPIVLGTALLMAFRRSWEVIVTWKTVALGVAISTLLVFIPYVGNAIWYAALLIALGGIYQVIFEKFSEVR